MRRFPLAFVLVGVIGLALTGVAAQRPAEKPPAKSDTEIRKELVSLSLASYIGNCPCPYNTDRAGRRCGARSAYNRPGGAAPLCYPADVTQKMIDAHRVAIAGQPPSGNRAEK